MNAGSAVLTALLLTLPASVHSGRLLIGHSVEDRRIDAVELGDPNSSDKLLIVGCIHGNECAGIAIVRTLERLPIPASVDLWVIENLNPDGYAAGTRQNAHGVDLNRNFPWAWRPLSGTYNSGPRPLSEPESRIAYRLILRIRPRISIWFHQHEQVVDESGGDIAVERRFSALVGLPLRRLPREPGSVGGWENHRLPGTTAFVVELPAGSLSPAAAARFARAVLALARLLSGTQIHLHAARAYSWISPPRRSRRRIRVGWWSPTRCRRRLGIGGFSLSARCGLCVL